MKNKEKYAKELMEIAISGYKVAIINGKPERCGILSADCKLCIGDKPGYCDREKVRGWAESEYEEPPVDWSKVPVDTKILVSDYSKDWYKRHFARYENGKVYAFASGSTSWSSKGFCVDWEYAKLAE